MVTIIIIVIIIVITIKVVAVVVIIINFQYLKCFVFPLVNLFIIFAHHFEIAIVVKVLTNRFIKNYQNLYQKINRCFFGTIFAYIIQFYCKEA